MQLIPLPADQPFPPIKRRRESRYKPLLDGMPRIIQTEAKLLSIRVSLCKYAQRHGMKAKIGTNADGQIVAQFIPRGPK